MSRLAAFVLALSASTPGCGTLVSQTKDRPGPLAVYGGVRADAGAIRSVTSGGWRDWNPVFKGALVTGAIVDLPLSLALDTALLPITLPVSLVRWID